MENGLLGPHVQIAALDLQVPAGWNSADSLTLATVRSSLAGDTSRFRFSVAGLHLDPGTGSMLLLKGFNSDGGKSFPEWAREYIASFRAARPGVDVRDEWMLVRDLPVVQLFASDSLRVHFSFLCDVPGIAGLDYVVPKSAWESQVRAVESSIGSARRMETK